MWELYIISVEKKGAQPFVSKTSIQGLHCTDYLNYLKLRDKKERRFKFALHTVG